MNRTVSVSAVLVLFRSVVLSSGRSNGQKYRNDPVVVSLSGVPDLFTCVLSK